MTDRISGRRTQTNLFSLGICTALIVGKAAVYGKGYTGKPGDTCRIWEVEFYIPPTESE